MGGDGNFETKFSAKLAKKSLNISEFVLSSKCKVSSFFKQIFDEDEVLFDKPNDFNVFHISLGLPILSFNFVS